VRFDAVIDLISLTYTRDAIGQEAPVPSSRQIFANEFMVSSAEYYNAGQNGLKPERQYQVRSVEYAGETLLSVDGSQYEIIRTQRRGEWTLLTCQRTVANQEAVS
jgi:SPP1 family predicted phage head-tail adaptor